MVIRENQKICNLCTNFVKYQVKNFSCDEICDKFWSRKYWFQIILKNLIFAEFSLGSHLKGEYDFTGYKNI